MAWFECGHRSDAQLAKFLDNLKYRFSIQDRDDYRTFRKRHPRLGDNRSRPDRTTMAYYQPPRPAELLYKRDFDPQMPRWFRQWQKLGYDPVGNGVAHQYGQHRDKTPGNFNQVLVY